MYFRKKGKRLFISVLAILLFVILVLQYRLATIEEIRKPAKRTEILASLVKKKIAEPAKRTEILASLVKKKIADFKSKGILKTLPTQMTDCKDEVKAQPCLDSMCSVPLSENDEEVMENLFQKIPFEKEVNMYELMEAFALDTEEKDVVFLTAASADFYGAVQALIRNLHETVFPHLNDYSFYLYDLGLTPTQRTETEKYCQCEVRTFPKRILPDKNLRCYTWKPLIIQAHISSTEIVIWMDSSVRFKNIDFTDMLQDIRDRGVMVGLSGYPLADHTMRETFEFFGDKTCQYSQYNEVEANFMAFHNEKLIRDAVVLPWAICALAGDCLCPVNSRSKLHCDVNIKRYNKCHRFDQSVIGMLLSKLFRKHVPSVNPPQHCVEIRRFESEQYFKSLKRKYDIV